MKKRVFSFLTLLLAAALTFSLVACSGGDVTITLSETTLELTVGESETLVATASDGSSVTWSSDNESVATVSSRGSVTAQGEGSATITAKSGDVTATCAVTVKAKEVVTISGLSETATVERGEQITLSATASDGSAIKWSSGDVSIATVDGGKVTGVFPGETTVIATTDSGARATCTLTVTYENAPAGWYELKNYEQNKCPDNTWGYWNDQNYNGSVVTLTEKPEYLGDSEDSEAGSVTFSYTSSGNSYFGMQLFYRTSDLKAGSYYTLNCKIDIDTDALVTLNGSEIELKEGENTVSVDFLCDDDLTIYPSGNYTNLSSAVFLLMGAQSDNSMVAAATVTVSEISWTEYTPDKLATPSVSVASDGTVTVTDTNEEGLVSGYRLGFYSDDALVWATSVQSGGKLDTSRVPNGTYAVKVMALSADPAHYVDSDWSDGSASYTVKNEGGVKYGVTYAVEGDAVADPYTWYYWWEYYAEDNEENPVVSYDNGTLTVQLIANKGNNFYNTQLFYKNLTLTEGQKYSLTMNVNSPADGTITVNGTVIKLVKGDNEIAVEYTEGSGASVSVQFGSSAGGIDINSGTFVFSDFAWEEVETVVIVDPDPVGTVYEPDMTTLANGDEATMGEDVWTYWYVQDASWGCGDVVSLTAHEIDQSGAIVLTYSGGSVDYCTQLFYKNADLYAGSTYTLTCKINASAACTVTLNGKEVKLNAGDNEVSVTFKLEGDVSSFDMQMRAAAKALTVKVSDVSWTKAEAGA